MSPSLSEKGLVSGMPSIHEGQRLLDIPGWGDIKTLAVVFTKPESFDGLAMLLCSITLVAIPRVMGKLGMQLLHVLITPGLGKDAGGRDGSKEGVAFYDTSVGGTLVFGEPVAIYQQEMGF